MFLRVEDLRVNYGQLEVLKGVSLDIEEGKISILLGANGSGKSTLLKAISGVVPSASGSVWFENKRIDGMPPHKIVGLGLAQVPEGKRLFRDMTITENLEMGGYLNKDPRVTRQDIDATFRRFPMLEQKQKEKSTAMSGGEQQILVIARALMAKPKLLLMDEPAQGLSPIAVNEVAKVITEINQSGITIILVEHNLKLGLGLAHTVYVLESGTIAFQAKADDLSEVDYAKKIYLGGR